MAWPGQRNGGDQVRSTCVEFFESEGLVVSGGSVTTIDRPMFTGLQCLSISPWLATSCTTDLIKARVR